MVHLYNLTIQKAQAITSAIYGNFSAPRAQELIVVRGGKILELLRPDEAGKVQCILSTEVFGLIRSIAPFRLVGASRDYVVIGSDSGRLVIIEYNAQKNTFDRVHQETYGKTGCRRIVPGQYVAVDPKGRAVMVGAVEKQKFVYVLNRDSTARLTISSPLEAHKSYTLCHAICGLDVGFDNPVFACLEVNYEEMDRDQSIDAPVPSKMLTLYEMDLGLNHVTRKSAEVIDSSAHALITVPGGADGPSGVLVCCESFLVYKKPNHDDVVCAIPRRLEMGQDKGLMIVAHATHRLKDFFFFLVQSEFGDLYKVTITHDGEEVSEVQVKYFDTIPVAHSLCVLKTGFLFAASEFGNHALYQFQGIGADSDDALCSSQHPLGAKAMVAFKPRILRNLAPFDELSSMSPIIDMKVLDAAGEGVPQIYALCGRGPRSTLRVLRHGLAVSEMAFNELPGKPSAVWTVRESNESELDRYIVVSFIDVTLVLSIGDTVEEVVNSGFLAASPTLLVNLMADDSYVQVHPGGFRHLQKTRTNEWRSPGQKRVVCAAANQRQIVLALTGGELVYFELDESRTLFEIAKREMGYEVTCLSVQPIPEDRSRSSFLAVGGVDNAVRILSLDRERALKQLAAQALPAQANVEDVCLLPLKGLGSSEDVASLFLNIGCNNGILMRALVDPVTGTLSDQRSRFLGARRVTLHKVTVQKQAALLALSAKPWLGYTFQGSYHCVPLSYDALEFASSFSSEQCPEGLVAIAANTLRILSVDRLGEVLNQQSIPLSFTPRRLTPLPPPVPMDQFAMADGNVPANTDGSTTMLAIVEADHNTYDELTKQEIRDALKKIKLSKIEEDEEDAMAVDNVKEEEDDNKEEDVSEEMAGTFKAGDGKWGSCLRIVDPLTKTVKMKVDMDVDEAAVSCCVCRFEEHEIPLLVVGTTFNMTLRPRKVPRASLKVYAYDDEYNLMLLHSTAIEDAPMALCAYGGRLLVGVGNSLRIYSLGKKKLLRKAEYKNLPEGVMWIKLMGDRIFVGDVRDSFHVLKFNQAENQMYVLADDTVPRWLTCGELLDYHTIMGGDKFDNMFICRVPSEAQNEAADASGLKLRGDTAYIQGKCHKFEHVMNFHLGETVMAIKKVCLAQGATEVVLWASLMGGIGALYPFSNREEVDFFQHLEMYMRTEKAPIAGRDHIMFRSFYFPLQGCIDGDLCEQYGTLPAVTQRKIADELEKTPAEILKKLEDIRNRIL